MTVSVSQRHSARYVFQRAWYKGRFRWLVVEGGSKGAPRRWGRMGTFVLPATPEPE